MNSAKSSWRLESSGVPQGSTESINHLHDRVWYTLSEFADDIELGGVADRSSRWDGCHPEGHVGDTG